MASENTNIKEDVRADIKEPGKYSVVFHNDDFTTMDFVTMILMHVFYKSEEEALKLMLKVHHEGKASVGLYSYDIASSKAALAMSLARQNGFPLRISVNKV
ncbi:MAG: ATP-dependent Clp protease adaptor ClpS [Muribaculaceae bacterium]|nr:ATP-dependent Clp protease adaptor ClpS [Muribaculaceae bacterium]